jgi:hypothetical protein
VPENKTVHSMLLLRTLRCSGGSSENGSYCNVSLFIPSNVQQVPCFRVTLPPCHSPDGQPDNHKVEGQGWALYSISQGCILDSFPGVDY